MKEAKPRHTPNIMGTVFLDLAFIIIASLILLVRDPLEDWEQVRTVHQDTISTAKVDARLQRVRSTVVHRVVEDETPGHSVYFSIANDGTVCELLANGVKRPLSFDKLIKRIDERNPRQESHVVLAPSEEALYRDVAEVRAALHPLIVSGEIKKVYEVSENHR